MNFTDTFDGTENPITTDFTTATGVDGGFRKDGGGFAYGATGFQNSMYYDGTAPGQHHKSTITWGGLTGTGAYYGAGVRYDTATGNGYYIESTDGSHTLTWKKVTGGSVGTLGSGTASSITTNDTQYGEADNANLTGGINGSAVETETDSSYSNGTGFLAGWNNNSTSNYISVLSYNLTDEFGGATTRGTPFGHRGTAFNGGRTFHGIIQ